MVVQIYGIGSAVCPQRVMHCLVEKEVAFEIIPVDLHRLEHKQPEHLAKQPFGQIPYIVDGDFELFESRAIVRYYAAKYSAAGPDLLGRTLEERARVEQWMEVDAINFNPLAFPVVYNLHVLPRMGLPGDRAAARESAERLAAVFDVYERQLAKSRYLAGAEFTLADLTHIPATRYLVEDCGMGRLVDDRRHVKAWWEEISRRPAWRKVMEIVGSGDKRFAPAPEKRV